MCGTCGGKSGGNNVKPQRKLSFPEDEEKKRCEESCKFCGCHHRIEELTPYAEPFPQIPQFPQEGIIGWYPIRSTCKRDIMKHMVEFQKALLAQANKARMKVKMTEALSVKHEEDPTSRVASQLQQLEEDIQQLKHELTVECLRQKYGSRGC